MCRKFDGIGEFDPRDGSFIRDARVLTEVARHDVAPAPPPVHRIRRAPSLNRPTSQARVDKSPRILEHRRPNAHRSEAVNRTELCARIAARSALSRADAATAVEAFVSTIADALKIGETVNIAGFGKFTASHRAPRRGRNPRTGESVAIPARTVPIFKAGKALRDRLND